ncbi:hypothetical protein F3Y22_tig00110945pilonHSYRG00344 [Hibiscus syriacus]|uniref:Uncharacterized protein n=1 Tax=Hibiscus syriacus TaxID=106335 RepID=A0A6A2ZC33_HIBSY|nr:hypothetical protein F3Y22_tig00110945pilonHSYRG00344 [Hibiscus syriacus]
MTWKSLQTTVHAGIIPPLVELLRGRLSWAEQRVAVRARALRHLATYSRRRRRRHAVGHGMSSSFIDQVRGVAKPFFGFPQEEKLKCSRAADGAEDYGRDVVVSKK